MISALLRWRTKPRQPSRREILLAVLYEFEAQGTTESSLPEVTESILQIQKAINLGYEFPEGLFYSHTLSDDLRELEFAGNLNYYEYRHDGFLPKSYYRLTYLGKERGRQAFERLSKPLPQTIRQSVTTAVEHDLTRWGMFARKKKLATEAQIPN